jgi:hypothetical protein
MGSPKEKSGMNGNPLNILEDMENLQEILNDEEICLLNNVFVDMKDFYLITDCIEIALSERKIDRRDLRVLYGSILKVVMHNVRRVEEKDDNYMRAFFNLPEIIHEWLFTARIYF